MTRAAGPLDRPDFFAWLLGAAVLTLAAPTATRADGVAVLTAHPHHLGTPGRPEWREFGTPPAEARSLRLEFPARANPGPATLLVRQRDVKQAWPVTLNGRRLGSLQTSEADLVCPFVVTGGTLRDGPNVLEIGPPAQADDAQVGPIRLDPRPETEALAGSGLDVRVTGTDGRPLPARITVVDREGSLAPLRAGPSPRLAVRTGVVYTADGTATISLPPGDYSVTISRGFEYAAPTRSVSLQPGNVARLEVTLARQVDTTGLVASDTHVHTLSGSGHGDATFEERAVTLAGEGVELPVTTEHDRLMTSADAAAAAGVVGAFTPVRGVEVTTKRGHFNAFPFADDERAPDSGLTHWPSLMSAIRGRRDDRVVVLNHPRDEHAGFRPFDAARFDPAVGADREGTPYTFDAVELVNSGAMQSDPMRVVRDWFALWNHGAEVTGVGASDSHDVSRYAVGQARTYVACPDENPGKIDVAAACRALREGRAVVSFGLLPRLQVEGKFGPGDLATAAGEQVAVVASVDGPDWASADRLELYANGVKVREQRLEPHHRPGRKGRVEWTMQKPSHDVALVLVASGPGATGPFWPVPKPYQPTSRDWEPRLLGVTNPVRLDADGNGTWNSPRYYAQFLIEIFGTEPAALVRALAPFDEAVATQAAAFCLPADSGDTDPGFARTLESAPAAVRRGFEAVAAGRRKR